MHLRSLVARHGRVLAAIAIAAAALTCSATPAAAAEKAIWGPATLPGGGSAMPLYDALGVDTFQFTITWSDVAPQRPATATNPADPAYRWPAEIAAAEAEAARRGIRLALLVTNSPSWANGGRAPIWAPTNPQDFADFMTAAARRFSSVRRWMIWGEPNRDDRFQPNGDNNAVGPRAYAPLLDAAYGALKAADSRNIVIGGMTWTGGTVKPPVFVRSMRLADGRPPRLDWFGHNPFPYRFPDLKEGPLAEDFRDISDADTFSQEVRRAYGRLVPLWMSEYTVQSDHGSAVFATFVSRAAQARYLTAGFKIADDLGDAVAGLGWFYLLDEQPSPTSANWGLLTSALERKPAFDAMVAAPSERLRPAVTGARTVSRATLRARGLRLRITPRASGRITIELGRGAVVRARVRATGRAGRTRIVRLRASVRPGRYTVNVRAARAATVRRAVRVR